MGPKMCANDLQSSVLSIPYKILLFSERYRRALWGSTYCTSGANSSGPRGPEGVPTFGRVLLALMYMCAKFDVPTVYSPQERSWGRVPTFATLDFPVASLRIFSLKSET